jgi:uncharacterized protein (DUF1330 family)
MLNLLKFADVGGREAYDRYSKVAYGTVSARGGSLVYGGDVLENSQWDRALLVRYPKRAAFLDMQSDPAYQGAIPDRTQGLDARLLYCFCPSVGATDDFAIHNENSEGGIYVVSLLAATNKKTPEPSEGEVTLRLSADMGLVADRTWNELVVSRHQNIDSARSTLWSDDSSLCLITRP